MLVMRRRAGEAIQIGADVQLRILSINRSTVKIGITAPREVAVSATDMEAVQQENWAAAQATREDAGAVAQLLKRSAPGIRGVLSDKT